MNYYVATLLQYNIGTEPFKKNFSCDSSAIHDFHKL